MVLEVKVLAVYTWQPEFDPWDLGWKKKTHSEGCPLTRYTHAVPGACLTTQFSLTHTRELKNKNETVAPCQEER